MTSVAQTTSTINQLSAELDGPAAVPPDRGSWMELQGLPRTRSGDRPGQAPSADAFLAAVRQVSELAHAKLPEALHGRLERATGLVLSGAVWVEEDGHTCHVRASNGQGWYAVNGHCRCTDHTKAPEGWCKHRLACALYRRVTEYLDAAPTPMDVAQALAAEPTAGPPAAAPAACEVPAIASTVLVIDGRRVEVKLCDTDDARLLARLTALLAQYPPAPAAVSPAAESSAPAEDTEERAVLEPTCLRHGIRMQPSKHAEGTFYCPKKDEETGAYCPERYPRKPAPRGGRR